MKMLQQYCSYLMFIPHGLETLNIYGAWGSQIQHQFRWLATVGLHQGWLH